MPKKRHKMEEIVAKLRQVYALISQESPRFSLRHEIFFQQAL